MTTSIRDIMTTQPMVHQAGETLAVAARSMRDADVGDVLVERDGELCGIVTDRDIVLRAVAEGLDPNAAALGDICSQDLVTLGPDDSVESAIELMRDKALRRLPICEDGNAVGIVSLGDLAVERDRHSVLADISASAPNN